MAKDDNKENKKAEKVRVRLALTLVYSASVTGRSRDTGQLFIFSEQQVDEPLLQSQVPRALLLASPCQARRHPPSNYSIVLFVHVVCVAYIYLCLQKSVLFNETKKESHRPTHGFKRLYRRLRGAYNVTVNKDDLTASKLADVSVVIFGAPRVHFTTEEIEALNAYVKGGGSVMFLAASGGDARLGTNTNAFLAAHGITLCEDAVVRTVYHKYLHPKQVYVGNGLLHPALAEAQSGNGGGKHKHHHHHHHHHHKDGDASTSAPPTTKLTKEQIDNQAGLAFVYPYGCTLQVARPAVPLLSSGPISFPLNRPVCAVSQSSPSTGRVAVLGSVDVFGDEWLEKEENGKLADVLLEYLVGSLPLPSLPTSTSLAEKSRVPDIASLADRLKPCLQEGEPLPKDFTSLFDDEMFKFDTKLIPEAVGLYDTLNVKVRERREREMRGIPYMHMRSIHYILAFTHARAHTRIHTTLQPPLLTHVYGSTSR